MDEIIHKYSDVQFHLDSMIRYWQQRLLNERKSMKRETRDLENRLAYIKKLLQSENILVIDRRKLNSDID